MEEGALQPRTISDPVHSSRVTAEGGEGTSEQRERTKLKRGLQVRDEAPVRTDHKMKTLPGKVQVLVKLRC